MGIFNTEVKAKIRNLADLQQQYRAAESDAAFDEGGGMEKGMIAAQMESIIQQIPKISTFFMSSDAKKTLTECTKTVRQFQENHNIKPSV